MMDKSMLVYNAIDSAATLRVHDAIWPELETGGYLGTYEFTARLFQPLLYMQTKGIRVNKEKLEEKRLELNGEIIAKQAELNELCGRELNVNSPKDCIKFFYLEKDVQPYTNRKTGKPTCDDLALQRLAKGTASRKGLPEARVAQQLRGLLKLRGTYISIEFDADGRLRCSVNPRGTWTGRISTSKTVFGTGMNLQNLPLAFKYFLVPDPGYDFCEIDKKGAEWVVVAYLSGDANMIRVCEEGRDPHLYTAAMMFGVSEEQIAEEEHHVGHETDPATIERIRKKYCPWASALSFVTRNMSMRQAGKKSNHGLNYDEGFRTFALINDMLESEAKRVINLYHKVYPGIHLWHDRTKHQLGKDRTLVNCFGRKFKFLNALGDTLFKQAYAALPQSTVVDLVNDGIIKCYEDRRFHMQQAEMLAQVHDSLLVQYPNNIPGEFKQFCKQATEHLNPTMEYEGREFQIGTDIKVGHNWAEMREVEDEQPTAGGLDKRVPDVH
jgi:DNA polymerase-1